MNINLFLNTSRVDGQDDDPFRRSEARRSIKMFLAPTKHEGMSDDQVPDYLVSEDMVDRYLALTPPTFSVVIPEFQDIVIEIERAFIRGLFFSTAASACVAIERLLNLARIELHRYNRPIKELWRKGPSNAWQENIDALVSWTYLDQPFADELSALYTDVRNAYLHSSALGDLEKNALRAANDAYKLIPPRAPNEIRQRARG